MVFLRVFTIWAVFGRLGSSPEGQSRFVERPKSFRRGSKSFRRGSKSFRRGSGLRGRAFEGPSTRPTPNALKLIFLLICRKSRIGEGRTRKGRTRKSLPLRVQGVSSRVQVVSSRVQVVSSRVGPSGSGLRGSIGTAGSECP